MAASVETVVIDIQTQGAPAAKSALADLETQIASGQSAVGGLTGAIGGIDAAAASAGASVAAVGSSASGAAFSFASLGEARSAIAAGSDALREMNAQLKVINGSTVVDIQRFRELKDAIAAQKLAINSSLQGYTALGGKADDALGAMARGANEAAGATKIPFRALSQEVKLLGGAAGAGESKMLRFAGAITKIPPGLALIVAAVVITLATLALLVAAFVKGIGATNAYRDEFLKLQGTLGGNAKAAAETQSAIDAVSGSSALGRDKITGYAADLAKAGLRGQELTRALDAMAIAGSAGGEEVAKGFLTSVQGAKAAGQSVDALSAAMKAKLGAVAAAQALSLGTQWEKFKENVTGLFSGADITPLLTSLHAVLSIFDQTSESGKSIKDAITGFVTTGITWILKLELALIKTYIWLKTHQAAWNALKAAAYGIGVVMAVVAAAIVVVLGVIGAAVGIVGLVVAAVIQEFADLWDAISGVGTMIKEKWNAITEWFSSLSWGDIGAGLLNSLTGGILGAIPGLLDGVKSAMNSAIEAAKNVFDMHSPSRVGLAIGHNFGTSIGSGAEDAAPDAAEGGAAAAGAVAGGAGAAANVAPARASNDNAPAAGETGPTFVFNNCTFGGDLTQERLDEMLHVSYQRAAAGG